METTENIVAVTLRIPGTWAHPGELLEQMPEGYRLSPEALLLPGGEEIAFTPMPPDDQFAKIFRSSCRSPASSAELETVDHYTVNVGLTGPGGSMGKAQAMMDAGAAIVTAGGGGVFIDNSALAHGGQAWIDMARADDPDAVSFAFVSVVEGSDCIWTMGMHVMGFPDLEMELASGDGETLIEVMRYVCSSDRQVGHGHVIANEDGPQFQMSAVSDDRMKKGTPMFNPWGRLQLTSLRRIADGN